MNLPLFSVPALGFFIGSIPTGYWLGKLLKGIDVRDYGSGNLGATNVFRVLGTGAGITTLVLDIVKGFLPAYACRMGALHAHDSFGTPVEPLQLAMIIGVAAILGHTFSLFAGFKGGKGVATSAGVFLALLPAASGIAIAAFFIIFAITRTVSASSIAAALVLALGAFVFTSSRMVSFAAAAVSALVIWKHRGNIRRILAGTEPRLGSKGTSSSGR